MAQFTGLNLTGNSSEEVADALIALNRSLEYQMDGNLDSGNVREIGGWTVGITEIASRDLDVGMSTDDSVANPVRFWAGSADKNNAPWRVYADGSIVLTKGTISWDAVPPPTSADVGALPVNSPMLTHITSTGVYTGTVTANQINAGELNGIIYNQFHPNTPNRRLTIRPSGISGTPDVTFWNDASTATPRGALYIANISDIGDGTGSHDYFSIWGPDRLQITGGYVWFNTGTVDFGNAIVKGTNFSSTAKFG